MPSRTSDRQRRGLAPLIAITAAALVFAILLILVRRIVWLGITAFAFE